MANPGGNYPGRQIGMGALRKGEPAFFYFGSGRSASSQNRYATSFIERESGILIEPTDANTAFDPFRHHYHAVRIDPETGLVVISNSEAPSYPLFEAYKFMTDAQRAEGNFVASLLRLLGSEYDNPSNPTPRIVGIIFPLKGDIFDAKLGITAPEYIFPIVDSVPLGINGKITYMQTYNGDVDYRPFDPRSVGDNIFNITANSAQGLANEIYGMSDYVDPKYGELRVWCVAGVHNGNGPGGWELARRNRHEVE